MLYCANYVAGSNNILICSAICCVTLRKSIKKSQFYSLISISVAPQLVPLTFGRDVVDQGDFAQLSCIAMKGDEPLSISWTFHGSQSGADPGILTSPIGSRGSMLVISRVGRDHNGNYTCNARNEAGSTSQTAVLRVNGVGQGELEGGRNYSWH